MGSHGAFSAGYKTAKSRPILYKRIEYGMYFLKFAHDGYYRGWRLTFKLFENHHAPGWKVRQRHHQELEMLEKLIPEDRIHDCIWRSPDEDYYEIGHCHRCWNTFENSGLYCSVSCENAARETEDTCKACLIPIMRDDPTVMHHVGYFPEDTVLVHKGYHEALHGTPDLLSIIDILHLLPSGRDAPAFREKARAARKARRVRKKLEEEERKKEEARRRIEQWKAAGGLCAYFDFT